MIILLLFNELELTRRLHQLLMVSSASINLIRVQWSHAVLAFDGWFAMTSALSPSVEIKSFIALRLQLGLVSQLGFWSSG